MNIFCGMGVHTPLPSNIWNDGYYFTQCGRCGREMLKPGGGDRWRPVPKNYRIVWKPRRQDDVDWNAGKAVGHAARPPLIGKELAPGVQRPSPLRQLRSPRQAQLGAPAADGSPVTILARLKLLQGPGSQ